MLQFICHTDKVTLENYKKRHKNVLLNLKSSREDCFPFAFPQFENVSDIIIHLWSFLTALYSIHFILSHTLIMTGINYIAVPIKYGVILDTDENS